MSAKEIVEKFYSNNTMLNPDEVGKLIHDDFLLDWHSRNGFYKFHRDEMIDFCKELKRTFLDISYRITHIIEENNLVSIRLTQFANTLENPREEMFIANYMVIWELKEKKLYRGYQMSHV